MNARVDHVLSEVLALPEAERSAIALALLDSLECRDDDGATVSEAWRAEVLKRREELRSGAMQAVPWEEVRQRLSAL